MKRTACTVALACALSCAIIFPFALSNAVSASAVTSTAESSQASLDSSSVLEQREKAAQAQAEASKKQEENRAAAEAAAIKAASGETIADTATPLAPSASSHEKLLNVNQAALDAIGTQASTGHSICCPSFSCAFADAVLDGTINDHSYYGCGNCVWTDWGGGNSFDRDLGSDAALLREAYDQISAGRPTVVHVAASYGEHWICLIGYTGVTDANNLELSNFICIDPWDGTQQNAGDRFTLYGDNCEHISSR